MTKPINDNILAEIEQQTLYKYSRRLGLKR